MLVDMAVALCRSLRTSTVSTLIRARNTSCSVWSQVPLATGYKFILHNTHCFVHTCASCPELCPNAVEMLSHDWESNTCYAAVMTVNPVLSS